MKGTSCTALSNASKIGGSDKPPCISVKSNALPEVVKSSLVDNSQIGVSTRYAHSSKHQSSSCSKETFLNFSHMQHWYAMRTTYSRERKAYDYIVSKGGKAFLPTLLKEKIIDGKKQKVEESRIPNIFFVYGTEDEVKAFAYDNVHLPYLRFYYEQHFEGVKIIKEPLIVPDAQIKSLRILCDAESEDIRMVPDEMIEKFREGDSVKIIEGEFCGVEGKVARWHGQQRVAIIIDGLCTIATAYIPTSFIKKI